MNINLASFILRMGFGLYMIAGHGWPKLMKFFTEAEIKFSTIFGLPAKVNLAIAVFVEFFCMVMIVIGFRTRLFIIPAIILMFTIVFFVKAGAPWIGAGSRELAMMYLIPFIAIFVLGSGKVSIDELLERNK